MAISSSLRDHAAAVLLGVISAALFFYVETPEDAILQMLASLTCLPLFVACLGMGLGNGVIAVTTGIAALLAAKSLYVATIYVVVYAVPTLALGTLALRRNAKPTNGHMLTAMTVYPCAVFLLLFAVMQALPGGLAGYTDRQMAQQFNDAFKGYREMIDPEIFSDYLNAVHHTNAYVPAIFGIAWIFVILFDLCVARWALKKWAWRQLPAFDFGNFPVSVWIVVAAAIAGLAGSLMHAPYDYIGTNLFAMLLTQLLLGGIATLRQRRRKS
jgi:hypothetical protein